MICSRDLKDLHPHVQTLCKRFLAACKAQGLDVIVTSTLRDAACQNALYAQGRTKPGRIVTNARAGQSLHNYGLAFDFVPVSGGKARWNDTATFRRCGEIAEGVGLEWAGRWKSFREMAHCQWTGGLSIKDLRSGKRPEIPKA